MNDRAHFAFTGAAQQWTCPAGVTHVWVDAIGGQGVATAGGWTPMGQRIRCYLPVTPGQVYDINVGGNASANTGGFNGGGNASAGWSAGQNSAGAAGAGGGATDIRPHGGALATRILVAAGSGGEAAESGVAFGGNPNGTTGNAGAFNGTASDAGGGGTPSAGGAAGTDVPPHNNGSPGTLGSGGNGSVAIVGTDGGGGAGGGGLYGGGGGSVHGGGGAGSSYTDPGATNVHYTTTTTATQVTLWWFASRSQATTNTYSGGASFSTTLELASSSFLGTPSLIVAMLWGSNQNAVAGGFSWGGGSPIGSFSDNKGNTWHYSTANNSTNPPTVFRNPTTGTGGQVAAVAWTLQDVSTGVTSVTFTLGAAWNAAVTGANPARINLDVWEVFGAVAVNPVEDANILGGAYAPGGTAVLSMPSLTLATVNDMMIYGWFITQGGVILSFVSGAPDFLNINDGNQGSSEYLSGPESPSPYTITTQSTGPNLDYVFAAIAIQALPPAQTTVTTAAVTAQNLINRGLPQDPPGIGGFPAAPPLIPAPPVPLTLIQQGLVQSPQSPQVPQPAPPLPAWAQSVLLVQQGLVQSAESPQVPPPQPPLPAPAQALYLVQIRLLQEPYGPLLPAPPPALPAAESSVTILARGVPQQQAIAALPAPPPLLPAPEQAVTLILQGLPVNAPTVSVAARPAPLPAPQQSVNLLLLQRLGVPAISVPVLIQAGRGYPFHAAIGLPRWTGFAFDRWQAAIQQDRWSAEVTPTA